MRIYIDNASQNKRIFEGKYQYLEGGKTHEKPSFHISVAGKEADYEIHFHLESEEELDSLIKNLEELRESK